MSKVTGALIWFSFTILDAIFGNFACDFACDFQNIYARAFPKQIRCFLKSLTLQIQHERAFRTVWET